ncbi:putative branched-chain-amino-acid aminotransferase [Peptoniphilus sp. ING2-D1G]|nr:putative branched-chain-amino-acid aminotransferase [Peptoniphilus sp. ING2-D1G]
MEIKFEKNNNPKGKITDLNKLGFGKHFTDHMFIMDYNKDEGWHDARIVPYGDICLDPSAIVFHYGQTVFEGLKAYKNDGKVYLFRPDENFKRLNMSSERLCIPLLDEEFALKALIKLIDIERDWVPDDPGASLYIRPFIISTSAFLGVKPSLEYKFIIILSPSGPYYKDGLKPVKIYVEDKYVRAVRGGMGMAKTGGNYAVSLKSQVEAEKSEYSQVLWLDGIERKYIEEVGAMNIFFVVNNKIITPALNGSILPGITRKSIIELLKIKEMDVEEKRISIDELVEAYDKGQLTEVFGTGTAAVISPVGELKYEDKIMKINNGEIGKISQELYDTLIDIQWGRTEGPEGWSLEV